MHHLKAHKICQNHMQKKTLTWETCTSQHTDQDSAIETMGQRQPVVHFSEQFWHLRSVLRFHFTLKSIHLVHSLALMVACQQNLFCILLCIKLTSSREATCQSTMLQLQNSEACWGNLIWDRGLIITKADHYSSCYVRHHCHSKLLFVTATFWHCLLVQINILRHKIRWISIVRTRKMKCTFQENIMLRKSKINYKDTLFKDASRLYLTQGAKLQQ